MVGKKRAHQPGYKPAKDSLGRTTWVPDGSHVKSKMESIEKLREYSDSITEEHKKIEGVKKESMVESSRKPPKVDRDKERLNELFALVDKHNEQIRNLVNSVFDGASFESTETGNALDANYVEEYVGEPFAFENEVDDFTIDFSYLDDKRKGVIRDMCHKYDIAIDNDTIFASEFFEVARENIDDVENINLQF